MLQKGTYRQKVVQRFAPDAFILITEKDHITLPTTNDDGNFTKIYFNEDVENINVSGSVEAPVATASFTVNVPRSKRDQYFINNRSIFELMMEVRIFIKGKYNLLTSTGLSTPLPYQQFWGLITDVSEEYSNGSHKITVSCRDMLYWLQTQKMSIRPSILTGSATGAIVQPFAGTFNKQNPKNIVATVVNFAYGGGGTRVDASGNSINGAFIPITFSSSNSFVAYNTNNAQAESKLTHVSRDTFVQNQKNIWSNYWSQKFGLIGPDGTPSTTGLTDAQGNPKSFISLLIYGFNGLPASATKQPNPNTVSNPGTATDSQAQQPVTQQSQNVSGSQYEATNFSKEGFLEAQQATAAATQSGAVTGGTDQSAYFDAIIKDAAPFGQITTIDTMHTEYQSLLDVCITCRDYIGYEFYMSLDGDIVFKPPFYNLDVKTYRPFVIKDVDLVSYNFNESDDVITVYSVSGNISQEVGTGSGIQQTGTAFDANLAQQFGLRVQTTDSQMSASNKTINQADFLGLLAQNEMDRHNAKRFSGSITLVGTPEIKMGYPIYIEPFDMYAYVEGISHSFNFGSSFQTTLTLTAFRRLSVLGQDQAMALGEPGDTTLNSTAVQTTEYQNAESTGKWGGTGTQMGTTRTLANASSSNADNFLQSKAQRVTDLDGYEVIGVIPYGANLLMDPTGNIVTKTAALNFSTTVFNGNSILANQVAGINPTTVSQGNSIPTTQGSTSSPPQPNTATLGTAISDVAPKNVNQQ